MNITSLTDFTVNIYNATKYIHSSGINYLSTTLSYSPYGYSVSIQTDHGNANSIIGAPTIVYTGKILNINYNNIVSFTFNYKHIYWQHTDRVCIISLIAQYNSVNRKINAYTIKDTFHQCQKKHQFFEFFKLIDSFN